MKKFLLVSILAFCAILAACNKSDSDENPQNTDIDKTANLQSTGDSANDILSNTNFDKMLIEVAYVSGFRPTNASITQFTDFLRDHTFKEDIEVRYLELDSPGLEDLELQEIADLEQENRTAYNDGRTLAVYIYFADVPSDGDDFSEGLLTVGAVYRNTSMVIYENTIRRLASQNPRISVTDIESATLNHEFGHLFGLVDLGSAMVNPHEDPEAENHCDIAGCLMRAELQFGSSTGKRSSANNSPNATCNLSANSVLQMLGTITRKGNNTVALDTQCTLDLRANGGR